MNLAEIRKKAGKHQEPVSVNQSQPLSFTETSPVGSWEVKPAADQVVAEPLSQELILDESPSQSEQSTLVEVVEELTPRQHQMIAAEQSISKPPLVEALAGPGTQKPLPLTAKSTDYDPLAVLLAGRESILADADDFLSAQEEASDAAGEEMAEYLCFRVSDEHYAVNIMEIKEIIKPRETTEVPRAPGYVAGVLSLRGVIIPIFDMRKRLGLPDIATTGKERIIVVKKEEGFCGILVDEVIQVARIPLSGIEPAPPVLDGIDRDFVSGIGRCEGTMIILLSLEHILDLSLV